MDNIRLIDANALIQEIREDSEAYYFNSSAERDNHFAKVNYAIDRISEAPTADTWIPVSERLPKQANQAYLVTVDYGDVACSCQRFFFGKDIGWNDDCVTAWQPLPEPYKEAKNDRS